MSDEYERYVAQREGAQIAASDDYFGARKSIDTAFNRKLVEEGFKRAYDIQESELTALRSQVAELQQKLLLTEHHYDVMKISAETLAKQLDEAAKQEPVDEVMTKPFGSDNKDLCVLQWVGDYRPKQGDKLYAAPINLPALIEQAKAEEREECAKVCEEVVTYPAGYGGQWEGYGKIEKPRNGRECAAAIRARKP